MGSCTSKTTVVQSCIVRVALLGDAVSGKSAIVSRFIHNKFSLEYQHNTKNSVGLKSYLLDESSVPVTIEIWEVQSALNIEIDTAIIVCDSSMSISEMQDCFWKWLQVANSYNWNNIHVAITKSDFKDASESYLMTIHQALALTYDQKIFFTSAQANKGIDYMFKTIIGRKFLKKA